MFLDELPEFERNTLEVLRQPLEEHRVTVSRVGHSYDYPADCIFVAAMNPCKCGFYPNREKCRCTMGDIRRYLSKISEPILDRLDICVETGMPSLRGKEEKRETSKQIRERVERTAAIQRRRYVEESISYNSELTGKMLEKYCALGQKEKRYVEEIFSTGEYSMRGISRILKVARTIADMEECEEVQESHITEAVCFRSLNREFWG